MIVVPSVESAGLSKWTLMKLYEAEGKPAYRIPKEDRKLLNGLDLKAVQHGIISIDGNPTKHYQLTELFALFDRGATRIESLDKLEYPWSTGIRGTSRFPARPLSVGLGGGGETGEVRKLRQVVISN